MKQATVIRHVPFEDLGSFASVLAQGHRVRYLEAGLDAMDPDELSQADILVVLGGPIGAYEEDIYPFLGAEIETIRRRIEAGRPVLGICLGAQLMARALGAAVYPGSAGKEIGWSPLRLNEAGHSSPLRHLAQTPVLHWHGDTFDVPSGATLLAGSDRYPHQAFAVGRHALALQFHPEVTVAGMERWFIGHACEIGATAGIGVPQLRADTRRYGDALERAGATVFSDWLARLD